MDKEGERRLDLEVFKHVMDKLYNLAASQKFSPSYFPNKGEILGKIERVYSKDSKLMKRAMLLARELTEKRMKSLASVGYKVGFLDLELKSLGMVGVATGPPRLIFEVGLSIDPILGLPFYPGSSTKGIAHKALTTFLLEKINKKNNSKSNNKDETKNSKREEERKIRNIIEKCVDTILGEGGEHAHASLVTFLDAYPIGCSKKECSVYTGAIITPHYYRGGEPVETELDVSPIPVPHLAIAPGLVFRFVIGVKADEYSNKYLEEVVLNVCDILPQDIRDKFEKYNEGPKELLRLIALAFLREVRLGSYARKSKGYNVMDLAEEVVTDFVVKGFGLWTPSVK